MTNVIGMVQDYKSNVPLHMLESKYGIPIHTIIKVLHATAVNPKRRASASSRYETDNSTKGLLAYEKVRQVL